MNSPRETADRQLGPGIVRNPGHRGGKPTIAGTRITVEDIIARLGGGWTIEDILRAFPHLTREQVLQAISYAAAIVHRGLWPQVNEDADEADWEADDSTWTSDTKLLRVVGECRRGTEVPAHGPDGLKSAESFSND